MRGDYYRIACTMRQHRKDLRDAWENVFLAYPEALEMFGQAKNEFFEKLDAAVEDIQIEDFKATQALATRCAKAANGDEEYWHITIRPKADFADFAKFKKLVDKYTKSKCFKHVCYTYEQKGTTEETLGTGFHSHLCVCLADRRTKSHALQAAYALRSVCDDPGIKFKPCFTTPDIFITNYLVDYKSKKGHKEATKTWDALWRTKMRLEAMYGDRDAFGPIPTKYGGDGSNTHTVHFD